MLKGHFRHTIVFSFPAASTWELGLCKLQKINMLLHTVPFSVFLGCVKIAAEIKKSSRKVILTIYSLHMRVDSIMAVYFLSTLNLRIFPLSKLEDLFYTLPTESPWQRSAAVLYQACVASFCVAARYIEFRRENPWLCNCKASYYGSFP